MNVFALLFFAISAIALLAVPKSLAPLPLLIGCCYMTIGQGIEIGPFSLPVYRMLLLVGVTRALVRGERLTSRLNSIDKMIIAWSVWVFIASFSHKFAPGSGPIYASGVIFNIGLIYLLIRLWCSDVGQISAVIAILAFLLAPIALEMIHEKYTGRNLFAMLGGVTEQVAIREGKLRCQGPFMHPILAGTVGAVCFPLFVGIWRRHPYAAAIGISASLVIVIASASSGPVMSLLFGLSGLAMWRFRHLTRLARWAAVGVYLVLMLLMSRPPYYLISKIDISGGSTGWHRCFLIEQTINHLPEWWLFGTDRTRHWMPGQGAISAEHTDITNYYIGIGVLAGLPALILVVAMLCRAFFWVGETIREVPDSQRNDQFMIWCFGVGLFAHAATSISVAYFDQSVIFFWLNLAVISSLWSAVATNSARMPETEQQEREQLEQPRGFPLTSPKTQ